MRYVGRAPASDFAVVTKGDVDTRYAAAAPDDAWIEGAADVSAAAAALVGQSYIDTQDASRAAISAVDTADANYLLATTRGAVNGVASIGSDGFIPAAQLPTLNTNRKVGFKNVDTTFISGNRTVTTTTTREFEAARLTIADPGYPYIPVPFCVIRGGAINAATPAVPTIGTGNYGQVTILDASLVKWGWCITTGQKGMGWNIAIPFADTTVNPTARPPVTGSLTLSVWLACWTGTTFTFDSTGMQFYCLIYPGL